MPVLKAYEAIRNGGMKKVQEQEQNLPMRYRENKKSGSDK